MPKSITDAGLKYAATAAVVLAHFQIEDQLADSGRLRWKALKRFFSLAYRKAAADLRAGRISYLDEMAAGSTRAERERRSRVSLEDVAEPTARATEMVFAHGAPELASIGRRFGYLVYVLDAWEDRARDTKTGDFNAPTGRFTLDERGEILAFGRVVRKGPAGDLSGGPAAYQRRGAAGNQDEGFRRGIQEIRAR